MTTPRTHIATSGRAEVAGVVPLHPEREDGRRFTELGNAERFVKRFGDSVRYVYASRSWIEFDGCRWVRDLSGGIERRSKEIPRAMYDEALAMADPAERAALVKHAVVSERKHSLDNMVALARSDLAIQPEQFDIDPLVLNVLNGTIDLRTGKLVAHRRADFITKLAPVEYDPEARCDRWASFLYRITGGSEPLIRYLQRAFGYSLTGLTYEQCLFLFFGRGANGKSTYLEVQRRVLGDYARQCDFTTFLERKGDGPRNDIARLAGARFVTASEAGEGRRLSESVIKSMTGSDVVSARFLHQEHFEFQPQFKITLATNHKPDIRGTDHGIWRRIRLVPFTVQIPESEQDPKLLDALTAELPGILVWAVAGCLMWQSEGLGLPPEVQEATNAYRGEMDTLGAFLDECCELGPEYTVAASPLYARYAQWCDTMKERTESQRAFGLRLTERGYNSVKSGTVRRIGLRLRTMDDAGQINVILAKKDSRVGKTGKSVQQGPQGPPSRSDAVGETLL